MGSKVQQTNPQQAQQSFNAANATAQKMNDEAAKNAALSRSYMTSMFGDGTPGSTGTLSGFTDPNSLNVDKPSGTYELLYRNQQDKIAQNSANAMHNVRESFANRGLAGSGMEGANARQVALGTAGLNSDAYAEAVKNTYGDAYNNFWNATNLKSGQAATIGARSDAEMGNAASTYNNLYGVSGQGHVVPGMGAALVGALGAAGNTMLGWCPARGSRIFLTVHETGTKHLETDIVEELEAGDFILQLTGAAPLTSKPQAVADVDLVVVRADNGLECRVGDMHEFVLPGGGYVKAKHAQGHTVKTIRGNARVTQVVSAGKGEVFPIYASGDHTYNCDGFWSLV